MAGINPNGSQADGSQLRERQSTKPLHLDNPGDAKQVVLELNKQEEKDGKDENQKKTYGRVPDGTGKLSYMCTTLEISAVLMNVNFLLTHP
jgi:phosphatidylethanolamine N-methyltransferase